MSRPIVSRLAAATFAAALATPATAEDNALGDLAGWWLSVDDTQPTVWQLGLSLPGEELLVIGADGAAETRLMRFFVPDMTICGSTGGGPDERSCSDAPAIQTAAASIDGDRLVFDDIAAGEAYDLPDTDDMLRDVTATAVASWSFALAADGNLLTLETATGEPVKRVFARVEPERLGRLRAGFMALQRTALQWRCYLTAMSAGDPAFAALGWQASPPPEWVDDWLEAESYRATLQALTAWPPGAPIPETVLIESFGIAPPALPEEMQALRLVLAYLATRASGMSHDDAATMSGVNEDALAIGEPAIAALARSSDPVIEAMVSCPEPEMP